MIFLDLKAALFIAILGCIGAITVIGWVFRHRRSWPRRLRGISQHVDEIVPFGMIVLRADNTIVSSNTVAVQIMHGLGTDTPVALLDMLNPVSTPSADETCQLGMLHRPLPVRWWRYPIENECTLLVLFDSSDQQQSIRQQQAFISHLSHEMRTPLTALIAHAEIIHNPQTTELVRRSSVETIQRETQRMARLVRDLFELYRLETAGDVSLRPTDLILVAEEAIAQVILRAEERRVSLTFEAVAPLPLVPAQPDRLKQVFLNLLDNAVKYCRPDDAIRVRLEKRLGGVLCEVWDSGPGIAAADLPHVAERLYRGRTDVEGSGIGLALVSEILYQHHSSLDIESTTEGQASGTIMRWVVPFAPMHNNDERKKKQDA